MPVDERTFVPEVVGWINEFLNGRPDLPFGRAAVEEHVKGSAKRHDFRLYRRHTDQPVLTGEIKMPDSPQGNHPLNAELVEDALSKLYEVESVRRFVGLSVPESGTASPGTFASSSCSTPTCRAFHSRSATSKGLRMWSRHR